jgi:rare lipoprotein A
MSWSGISALALGVALTACGGKAVREPTRDATGALTKSTCCARGYYQNDGPGENPPPNLEQIPDAEPKAEPLHRFANRPYTVLGRDYVPLTSLQEHREQGLASWYGRQFHLKKTAIGETYDMYAMTAAHPTLPLPSYARVTNVATGSRVIVRVNDRGPFYPGRIIDLSFAAAHKLGIAQRGSGEVLVESVLPGTATAPASAPPESVPLPAAQAAAVPPIPVREERTGLYLQLGAFTNYANAQNFLDHVQSQVVWLGETARVSQRDGLYRVLMGPYPDAPEARRVGNLVKEALAITPSIQPQ